MPNIAVAHHWLGKICAIGYKALQFVDPDIIGIWGARAEEAQTIQEHHATSPPVLKHGYEDSPQVEPVMRDEAAPSTLNPEDKDRDSLWRILLKEFHKMREKEPDFGFAAFMTVSYALPSVVYWSLYAQYDPILDNRHAPKVWEALGLRLSAIPACGVAVSPFLRGVVPCP
ncbi:hypothetical protein DL768_007482 [Monosporascus sp. mg162]|nr:hypothetical protein DL768_007482 [Monosporascus sp. mg162]